MKKLILLLLITTLGFAQAPTKNANGFFAGTGTMNASAIGQFDSASKGFLFPRMTTTQRNAIASPATSLVIFNTTTGAYNYWNGTAWTTFGGGEVPTLQQILDNNHDLVDNNNFQGTEAGEDNTGTDVNAFGFRAAAPNSGAHVNAFGQYAAKNNTAQDVNAFGQQAAQDNTGTSINAFGLSSAQDNTGNDVNAFGSQSAQNNTGDYVNSFGWRAGFSNTFKNVNLFGYNATADADNQTVFSKWVTGTTKYLARLSYNNITADRKWELPNANGTIALTSDISNSIAPLEINSTDKTVWNNGKANESTNTSFGEKALKSNTTGSQSTAYGIQALQENTTGELNSAFGANALQNNTTGTRNTAVGSVALYSNTTGSKNTAVGQIALYSNTTGSNNTVVGQDALRSNTTASNNTAMGHEAMYSTTTGADNTAVGKDALENNTTGNENIAIGGSALTFNTTGSGNTAIGRLAGISLTGFNTNPTNSIYIGRNAYALAANQTNQIVIGENTTGAGSNTVTLGNSSITTTRLRGAVQGDSFVKDGGTSSQILMADGSVATAGSGITISSGTISASGGGSATWGGITGTLSTQTDLQNALNLKANLASPTFTGTVSAPTPTANDNSTKVATTAYVDAKVQNSLTASTTIAPSATVVNNEINKTRRLIAANSASTVTGTTTEAIISSLLIPANSFDSLCDIWTTFTYGKNTAAGIPIKLYYNTTNSLSGATQLALYTTGSFRNGMLNRKYLLNGTGLDLLASAPTTSLYNSEIADALFTTSTVITIAPTSDIYFIYTVQNDAVGTTFNHKRSTVEKLKLN